MDERPRLYTLAYHDIVTAGPRSRYGFTLGEFREHVSAITARIEAFPAIPGRHGEPTGFALTFDDGGPGWLAAAEALAARGWQASYFIVTGALGEPGSLSRADVRRIASMGHTIGTHSVDHPADFSDRDEAFMRRQWRNSKSALEDILGREVTSASIPGGRYAVKVARAAEAEGLTQLFTSEPVSRCWSVGGCRVMGRFSLRNGMSSRTVARLASGARPARAGYYLGWNVRKAVKSAFRRPSRALLARRGAV